MKKLLNKKLIGVFICICIAVCALPMAAFAQQSSSGAEATSVKTDKTDEKEEKEVKKTQISLGSSYKKVYDGKEISKSDVYALVSTKSGGATVFTYQWYDANGNKIDYNPVNAGHYKLSIKVSEKDPYYTGSATVSYIIEKRPLEWDVSQLKVSKPYDGTTAAAKIKGELDIAGIIEGDDVEFVYDSIKAADFSTPDVQRVSVAITVDNGLLNGTDADNYSLPKINPTAEAAIIKAVITEMTFEGDSNKYRLVVMEEIGVTQALAATEFNTEENIKAALRAKIGEKFADKEFNAVYYTTVLQVLENEEWVDVSDDKLPQNDAEITLQYPEGTSDKANEFVVYRMKTGGDNAGEIEVWVCAEKVEGLETVLSQGDILAVGYTAEKQNNTMLFVVLGAAAVMVAAGAVFMKLHRTDKEESEENEQ